MTLGKWAFISIIQAVGVVVCCIIGEMQCALMCLVGYICCQGFFDALDYRIQEKRRRLKLCKFCDRNGTFWQGYEGSDLACIDHASRLHDCEDKP